MKIINASYEIVRPDLSNQENIEAIYKLIEEAGRTCYVSGEKANEGSAEKFIKKVISQNHDSVLEHASMTVRFTTNRAIANELVRHRLASFSQESTRYCNYSNDRFGNEITVIKPFFFSYKEDAEAYDIWKQSMENAEKAYFALLDKGLSAQEVRGVLPNDLKTVIVMTANIREWRHVLNLRAVGTTGAPHPQMSEIMLPLLDELTEKMPALFGDLVDTHFRGRML